MKEETIQYYKSLGFKEGFLTQDYKEIMSDRDYLKGSEVLFKRTKYYDEDNGKWTGQFRTHYVLNDSNGREGSFTIFYLDLIAKPKLTNNGL